MLLLYGIDKAQMNNMSFCPFNDTRNFLTDKVYLADIPFQKNIWK